MIGSIRITKKQEAASSATIIDSPIIVFPRVGFNRVHNVQYTLTASTHKVALIVTAPKSGTITKVGFYVGSFVSAGTPDVRIETVDTSTGHPTGTLAGTNTNGSVSVASTGYKEATLTSGITVTAGQVYALVIANDATGSFGISTVNPYENAGNPYVSQYLTSWTKLGKIGSFAIGYSDGTYPEIVNTFPTKGTVNTGLNLNSSPDEAGNKFVAPFAMRVCGFVLVNVSNADCDLVLYDSSNNVVLTASFDKDLHSGNSDPMSYIYATSTATLTKGETYRLVYKPTTASGITVPTYEYDTVAIKESSGHSLFSKTSRTDGGAWTDDTGRVLNISLMVNGFLG